MKTPQTMHNGTVVSIDGNKLTTTCGEGKQHVHNLAADARITCDWKESKASDLKAGTNVRVTTKKDDKATAVAVESGSHVKEPMSKA